MATKTAATTTKAQTSQEGRRGKVYTVRLTDAEAAGLVAAHKKQLEKAGDKYTKPSALIYCVEKGLAAAKLPERKGRTNWWY